MPASGVMVGTKDQATERYGVVQKEMTDGVAKGRSEYEMLVFSYEES